MGLWIRIPLVFFGGLFYFCLSEILPVQQDNVDLDATSKGSVSSTTPRRPYEQRLPLSRNAPEYQTDVFILSGSQDGPVAMLLGGTHGNEPGGYLTLLEFLSDVTIEKGTLVIVPIQNPIAFSNNSRSTRGPVLNNYYNFGRGFPALKASAERDKYVLAQLSGYNNSWWWYDGDEKLIQAGVFPGTFRKATEVEDLLDEEGYRRALDPEIKKAAGNIYQLMLGNFPDGSSRYDQIDILIDLHEAAYFYEDRICTDDPVSHGLIEELVPEIH